ncbi:hypothetical protein [Salinarchaeum laminariae]|uniref:hypothetical protein n=1 Tax=Salinarchaeum laminariae TaxID=869888 RepID=UPI0020BFD748|nr:hypothetical protein [Salinarchaeum laminariae]
MRATSFALGLLVAALLATAAVPSPALAQAQNNSTNGQDAAMGYEERVDDDVILTDWEYSDGRFLLTFEASRTSIVTISEVVSTEEAKAGSLSIQERTISEGTTTVEMPAGSGPSGAAAVTITTSQSIDEGRGVFISTGQQSSNPFGAFGGTQGLFAGIVISCLIALLAAIVTLWREKSGVQVAS